MEKSYYLGCCESPGHYLFEAVEDYPSQCYRVSGHGLDWMLRSDSIFPPQPEREVWLYKATMCYLHGYTIISWWDRSVDKRPGSNSTLFLAKVFTNDATGFFAALNYAEQRFPWVFQRLPQRITRMVT